MSDTHLKLPTIKLPNFTGKYTEWLEFRDMFPALVDNNESLSLIQRFYYLKSSLSDEHLEILAKLDTTAINYSETWSLLIERYENKPLMIHNHMKAIFERSKITKKSHMELCELYDSVSEHLSSLKS